MGKLKVVTLGGGNGHAQVLKAVKSNKQITVTAIVPSTDSGGSTGVLIEQYGALGYIGDLTRCIAALCPDEDFAKTLMYRYGKGAMNGHSVKNLLLFALEDTLGRDDGLEKMWDIAQLGQHRVIPVNKEQTELHARLKMGSDIKSETNIDTLAKNPLWHPDFHAIESIYLKPEVEATDEVKSAIKEADYIIITPGDLYSSIIATLMPGGIEQAIKNSKAKLVMILNIVNKKGETDKYTADDFVLQVEKYTGREIELVFINDSQIEEEVTSRYALEDKIVFTADNIKEKRTVFAPFAKLNENGELIHGVDVLKQQLTTLFNK